MPSVKELLRVCLVQKLAGLRLVRQFLTRSFESFIDNGDDGDRDAGDRETLFILDFPRREEKSLSEMRSKSGGLKRKFEEMKTNIKIKDRF